ncbi:tyrosine-protein phosphatase [Clostridium tarantellae]|uniref:protein-tyrosine-phosphatase n=1 Tax=Clostridium tarantellae TaxID=39493 RepID=A0A6I1MMN4_9CLOT|nr:CpsB/CapC family capsule biosynthesis tyrosine phosphatase [Clostridium tarantellae]MPQ43502.1 capsular biosynthesis protein [Clostridium tarantellae]
MIDIHSHIIPAIDDGAKDIEITLEMLKRAEEEKTTSIIATPHYIGGMWETSYDDVKKKVEKLNELARAENINLKIHYGQEIYYHNEIVKSYDNGLIGTLANSRYMLIEFSMHKIPRGAMEQLYELQIKGIVPIIAHPERYDEFKRNPEEINKFIEEGYLFQLNSGSICGVFGKEVRKTAELFLKNNIYSFIGSDAHSNERRHAGLKSALTICDSINENYSNKLLENGEKLLRNKEVLFHGNKIKKKKGLFSFIFKK